jgi:integrase/recombinase XerD
LLKFVYHDFLDDRRFKNTTKTNIKNDEMLLGKFVEFCIENEVINVEDIVYNHVRQNLLKGLGKGDKAGASILS